MLRESCSGGCVSRRSVNKLIGLRQERLTMDERYGSGLLCDPAESIRPSALLTVAIPT